MRPSLQIVVIAFFAAALPSLAAPITEPLDAIHRDINPSEPSYPTPNSIPCSLFGLCPVSQPEVANWREMRLVGPPVRLVLEFKLTGSQLVTATSKFSAERRLCRDSYTTSNYRTYISLLLLLQICLKYYPFRSLLTTNRYKAPYIYVHYFS